MRAGGQAEDFTCLKNSRIGKVAYSYWKIRIFGASNRPIYVKVHKSISGCMNRSVQGCTSTSPRERRPALSARLACVTGQHPNLRKPRAARPLEGSTAASIFFGSEAIHLHLAEIGQYSKARCQRPHDDAWPNKLGQRKKSPRSL